MATNWTNTSVSKTLHTDTSINKGAYTEIQADTSIWYRNSGIDDGTTYDDPTIAYDAVIYYDDYDATTVTADDVSFTDFADSSVNKSHWSD